MKINTKHTVGEMVFVPIIERMIPELNEDVYGVTIKKVEIRSIEVFEDEVYYKWGYNNHKRTEPFVFKTLKEAKAHAHKMNKQIFEKNKKYIDSLEL